MIETLAMRSMSKAVYSTNPIGHYGLGFEYYSHFTSPIRRYPDLIAHRLLQHYLDGGKSPLLQNTKNIANIAVIWNVSHQMQKEILLNLCK